MAVFLGPRGLREGDGAWVWGGSQRSVATGALQGTCTAGGLSWPHRLSDALNTDSQACQGQQDRRGRRSRGRGQSGFGSE